MLLSRLKLAKLIYWFFEHHFLKAIATQAELCAIFFLAIDSGPTEFPFPFTTVCMATLVVVGTVNAMLTCGYQRLGQAYCYFRYRPKPIGHLSIVDNCIVHMCFSRDAESSFLWDSDCDSGT